jgi:hypothetical protein
MGSQRIVEALYQAEALFDPVELGQLGALANHPDAQRRLLALALIRREIARGAPATDYLPLARTLVEDPDNGCRWQALIVIGEALRTSPEDVWSVIRAHGGSQDSDLRTGVATVLLKHLLKEHFKESSSATLRAEWMIRSSRDAVGSSMRFCRHQSRAACCTCSGLWPRAKTCRRNHSTNSSASATANGFSSTVSLTPFFSR